MITITPKAAAVIKHYPVEMISYTTYNQLLIHNETTGEITMTGDGMSTTSYNEFFPVVKELFIEKMNLNSKGKMKRLKSKKKANVSK